MKKLLIGLLATGLFLLTPRAFARTEYTDSITSKSEVGTTTYYHNLQEKRHQMDIQDIAQWADQNSRFADFIISRRIPKTEKYRTQRREEVTSHSFTLIKTPLPIPLMDGDFHLHVPYGRTLYRGSQNFSSWHLGAGRMIWLSPGNWAVNPSAELQSGRKKIDGNIYHLTGINLQTEFLLAGMLGAGPALAIHHVQFSDRKDSVVVTPCISATISLGLPGLYFNWKGGLPFGQEFKRYNDWHFGMSIPILDKPSRDRLKESKKAIEYEIRTEMACIESQSSVTYPCPCPPCP